jgi:hypothetical protein
MKCSACLTRKERLKRKHRWSSTLRWVHASGMQFTWWVFIAQPIDAIWTARLSDCLPYNAFINCKTKHSSTLYRVVVTMYTTCFNVKKLGMSPA